MRKHPLVITANNYLLKKLLNSKGLLTEDCGSLFKVSGFAEYNNLIELNKVFSSNPKYFPIDRTCSVKSPIKWAVQRPWVVPTNAVSLDDAMAARVFELASLGEKINVFWSGGIDSTAIVTAFLKNLDDCSQLRVLYSPWSYYEHPEYFDILKKIPQVELIDQSGEIYFDLQLDGIFVSGNSGDEIHASIDSSFLEKYGYDALNRPWKDFFVSCNNDPGFIDFCEEHFKFSGFDIKTVLETRWWFYTSCKINSILREYTIPLLLSNKTFEIRSSNIYGFFDCDQYENFIYWNIESIMRNADYSSWKQILKDYCYSFDKLAEWRQHKTKFHSNQLNDYTRKKTVLNDKRYIFILDDDQMIQTPNLPFFSSIEFDRRYGNSLDYLFNDTDKI